MDAEILRYLRAAVYGATTDDLVRRFGSDKRIMRGTLERLRLEGRVARTRGAWRLAGAGADMHDGRPCTA